MSWRWVAVVLTAFLLANCDGGGLPEKDLSRAVPSRYTLTYRQRQGQVLFSKYCSVCHGDEGRGDGFNAYNLEPHPRDLTDRAYMGLYSRQRLAEVITQGGRGINKSTAMPAWGNTLSPYQVEDLVDYLVLLNLSAGKIE